ncbi:MAG TPA: hypothetical protein VE967_15445, partial [Gemmatimonadaceae bacterium]|nr:hypothetical protein [Gemmatimonadaceae bacterium]
NGSTNEVVAANDGTIWVRAAFPAFGPGGPAPMTGQRPMIHYDISGNVLDSLVQGPGWLATGSSTGAVREWWAPIPDGRVMLTRTDKVGFLLSDPKRTAAPIIVEAQVEPVKYTPEERKELEALEDFVQTMPRSGRPAPPRRVFGEIKPVAYGASVDVDGRIWVSRPGPAQKTKPRIAASYGGREGSGSFSTIYQDQVIFAGFRADGTFLGEVRFPAGVRPTFVGNTAWGIVRDEDDTPVLVKYRIY